MIAACAIFAASGIGSVPMTDPIANRGVERTGLGWVLLNASACAWQGVGKFGITGVKNPGRNGRNKLVCISISGQRVC